MRSVGGKDKSLRGSSSSKKFKSTHGPSHMLSTLALNETSLDTTHLGSALTEPTASASHNHHDVIAARSISAIARNQSTSNNGTLMPASLGTFPIDYYVLRQLSSLTSVPSLETPNQNSFNLPIPNASVPFQPSLATPYHLSIMGCAPMNNPMQPVLDTPFVTNHSGTNTTSLPLGPQPLLAAPLQTSWAPTLAAAMLDPCTSASLVNLPTLTIGNANLTASLPDRVSTGSSLGGLVPHQPCLLHTPWQLEPDASASRSGPDWLNGAMNHLGTLQDSLMASNPTVAPSLVLQSDRLRALLAATESTYIPSQVGYASVDATPPLPFVLTSPTDGTFLSEFQVLLRRHIEVFAATTEDIESRVRGRSKQIRLHQIGLRCRHCAHVPPDARTPGSTYFPVSTLGLYQAAQNMSSTHVQCGLCPEMPESIKTEFATLLATKMPGRYSKGGRKYWSQNALDVGLVNAELGIFPGNLVPIGMSIVEPHKSTTNHRVD